jgi:tetratricopeptide (TPR) repeat protein
VDSWPAILSPPPSVRGAVWKCVRNPKACPLTSELPNGEASLTAKELYAEGRWEELLALPASGNPDPSNWLWIGVAEARTGNCQRAIRALERGLRADGGEGHFYLQICYAEQESRAESKLEAGHESGALHELRGDRALIVSLNAAEARKEYSEALRSRLHDSRLLAKLAKAYAILGDDRTARRTALTALASDPQQASAIKTLVQLSMNQRDYDDALKRLNQLAVLRPTDAWTQVELGVAYAQLGQPAKAVSCLSPHLAAGYPDQKGALHAQLAKALRKLGRTEEADQAAEEASRLANAAIQDPMHEKTDAQ